MEVLACGIMSYLQVFDPKSYIGRDSEAQKFSISFFEAGLG